MGKSVRVGVVGLGQRGLQHLKALWKLQGEGTVEVAALVDPFAENLAEEKLERFVPGFNVDGVRRFEACDRLFAAMSLDALYFCIPPGLHKGELLRAVRSGIHIFAEKPMSLFLDEAIQMDAAIREAGVISTAGFQRRYESSAEAAAGFLADKRMVMMTFVVEGALESHSVKHTRTGELGGPADRVWTKNLLWSGSSVVEAGIHQVDLMRYWCGDIAWVQAAYVPRDAEDVEDGGDNPYAYSVMFGFRNGAVGNLMMSKLRKVYRGDGYENILWNHGHLKFEGDELAAYYYDGVYPPAETPKREQLRHVIPVPPKRDATEAITRAFVEAVARGDESLLKSTFSSSMNSLAAVLAANVSHERDGERIDLERFASGREYERYRRKVGGE